MTVKLVCPSCQRTGVAKASEADYPFMRSLDFTIDEIPDGFKVETESEHRSKTEIRCDCGTVFKL